ncbi:rRNA processing protein Ebp2 [Taphrina deformans PYCC 5710]|uniref:rRNA processing protein Ebp2 n=1 Tax=Taphrina deformans (strain PYCC 5710 / ATCC 11124 / CBS 356.35 / IMI 108563 / JCM 9778 / NBRC 8474) TaxID=1097556 RepID=R4XBS3_TAPDE|nr:rRNA processing protein Ebp2 [Taphrina deformans PYCC 5710]|eukprot:CCG81826.1 rRNA processing protein Ebp2 [Taphrina deformans PYCC 5710]
MARKARGPNATSAKVDPAHGKGRKSKKVGLAEEVRGMLPKSRDNEKTSENTNGRKVSASGIISLSTSKEENESEEDEDDDDFADLGEQLSEEDDDELVEEDEDEEELSGDELDVDEESAEFSDSSEGSEAAEIDVDQLEGIQDVEALESTDLDTIQMPDEETLDRMEASLGDEDVQDEDDEDSEIESSAFELAQDEEDGEEDEELALSEVGSDKDDADIVAVTRETVNNVTALNAAYNRIALALPDKFSLHQTLTTAEPLVVEDVNDDLKRELEFYKQGLTHATEARNLITKEGAAWERPSDYFAEMVKTDDHMERIRKELVQEATAKKASAEARKQRDLKKFGKQVQINKTLERAKEKKATTDKIKALKRKRGDNELEGKEDFDVALDEAVAGPDSKRSRSDRGGRGGRGDSRGGRGGRGGSGRESKDQKYGFGGKKRFAKSNTAESTFDMAGFNNAKPGRGGRGGGRGGSSSRGGGRGGSSSRGGRGRGAPRPGKSKRG